MDLHPNATTDSLDVAGVEAGPSRPPHRMTTDELVLERVHPDGIAFDRLHALFGGVEDADGVFELCGWDAHGDATETREFLDERAERWERGEYYEYVLDADGEYVGTACLEVADDDSCEFGCWLDRPYWGRGFAGEATDALVHAAFACLDAPYVVAGCLPANGRSRRAIEKFVHRYGGAYYGSPPVVSSSADEVVPHHEWAITREQFDSGEAGLSTLVPGVEYEDLAF